MIIKELLQPFSGARVQGYLHGVIAEGVTVFYDKFEEATQWGENLYTHLNDV
jgi:hypothetical protein